MKCIYQCGICQYEGKYANMKGNMPIWREICHTSSDIPTFRILFPGFQRTIVGSPKLNLYLKALTNISKAIKSTLLEYIWTAVLPPLGGIVQTTADSNSFWQVRLHNRTRSSVFQVRVSFCLLRLDEGYQVLRHWLLKYFYRFQI